MRIADRIQREIDPFSVSAWDIIDPEILTLDETLRLLDEERAFDTLLQLPERRKAWTFYDRRAGRYRRSIDVNLQDAMHAWINGMPIPDLARQWLPDAPIDWALEQTVANISQTFEHYLSWTLGALIHITNDHLTKAAAPLRLRPDTAWCVRYGVDTEQAIHLLTSGVHSRTLAHAIGRQAAAQDVAPTELRAWLAQQHITWRATYHPSDLEIDDLIEYVRVRKRSLLRALLKDGEITIEVEGRPAWLSAWPSVAKLRWTEAEPTNEIDVTNDQGDPLARISAGDHADVVAILKSGLPISVTLQGTQLLISRARGER